MHAHNVPPRILSQARALDNQITNTMAALAKYAHRKHTRGLMHAHDVPPRSLSQARALDNQIRQSLSAKDVSSTDEVVAQLIAKIANAEE